MTSRKLHSPFLLLGRVSNFSVKKFCLFSGCLPPKMFSRRFCRFLSSATVALLSMIFGMSSELSIMPSQGSLKSEIWLSLPTSLSPRLLLNDNQPVGCGLQQLPCRLPQLSDATLPHSMMVSILITVPTKVMAVFTLSRTSSLGMFFRGACPD